MQNPEELRYETLGHGLAPFFEDAFGGISDT